MNFTDVFGFDISKWQAAVDFAKMKAYGAQFLILRCAHGNTTDERFIEYMANSEPHFPSLSVYHYYDPYYTPTQQANKVISILDGYKSRVKRVWLDLEFSWTGNYQAPEHWKTYRDLIKAAGYKVGWYTRASWWDSRVGTFVTEFGNDPFWVAQYNTSLTLIPKGAKTVYLWQKGTPAIGLEAGVSSLEIDLDLWNNDFDFAAEFGTPPDGGIMDKYYKVTTTALNIRSKPEAGTSTDLGAFNLVKDDIVNAVESVLVSGVTFVRFDVLWRGGVKYLHPFSGAPLYVASPTGNYWSAEKGDGVWMVETVKPSEPPPPVEAKITEIILDLAPGSVVTIKRADGTTETETA